jgi:hypothetical protein
MFSGKPQTFCGCGCLNMEGIDKISSLWPPKGVQVFKNLSHLPLFRFLYQNIKDELFDPYV